MVEVQTPPQIFKDPPRPTRMVPMAHIPPYLTHAASISLPVLSRSPRVSPHASPRAGTVKKLAEVQPIQNLLGKEMDSKQESKPEAPPAEEPRIELLPLPIPSADLDDGDEDDNGNVDDECDGKEEGEAGGGINDPQLDETEPPRGFYIEETDNDIVEHTGKHVE